MRDKILIEKKMKFDRYNKAQINLIKEQIRIDRDEMLSILKYDKKLIRQINDLFDINLKDVPVGKEILFFSKAVFKINDVEGAKREIERLNNIEYVDEDKKGINFLWMRPYPKGHWSPMSRISGASQILGDIRINFNNTLILETKTKSYMIKLIFYMRKVLGKEIILINLEIQNALDLIKNIQNTK